MAFACGFLIVVGLRFMLYESHIDIVFELQPVVGY
jgi:hypothetical protein